MCEKKSKNRKVNMNEGGLIVLVFVLVKGDGEGRRGEAIGEGERGEEDRIIKVTCEVKQKLKQVRLLLSVIEGGR